MNSILSWQLEVCLTHFKRSGLKAFNMFIQNFFTWERFWPGSQLPRPISCQSGIMLRVQEGPSQGLAPQQDQHTPSRLPSKQWQMTRPLFVLLNDPRSQHANSLAHTEVLSLSPSHLSAACSPVPAKIRLKKLIFETTDQGHAQYPLLCLFSTHKPTGKWDT